VQDLARLVSSVQWPWLCMRKRITIVNFVCGRAGDGARLGNSRVRGRCGGVPTWSPERNTSRGSFWVIPGSPSGEPFQHQHGQPLPEGAHLHGFWGDLARGLEASKTCSRVQVLGAAGFAQGVKAAGAAGSPSGYARVAPECGHCGMLILGVIFGRRSSSFLGGHSGQVWADMRRLRCSPKMLFFK
jgi:hypothetical protein